NLLQFAKFEVAPRAASGQIHVVEMDAASIDAINQWPWSREHYAKVIEQLHSADVQSISFDVDFSSASTEVGDREFALSLSVIDTPVILPTFSQAASFGETRKLDSLPIGRFREHTQLASVSIAHDADGFVRRMPLGTITSGVPRPSLSAFVAQRSGLAGESYPIDFAIDPNTIPRHSFIDIERGDFDRSALAGKDVLIGATAIEVFDRYAVPSHGVIPGVVVQALAAETLLKGTPLYGSWELPLFLTVFLAWIVLSAQTHLLVTLRAISGVVVILAVAHFSQSLLLIWFEVVPALALLTVSSAIRSLWIVRRTIVEGRQIDRESGLPNHYALQAKLAQSEAQFVVAAMMSEFDTLKAVLGRNEMAILLRRIVERLEVSGCDTPICRTDDRVLSWQTAMSMSELEELLAGLRAVMRSPIEISGRRVDVNLTFGLAHAHHEKAIVNAAHAASAALRAGEHWRLHEHDRQEQLEQAVSLMGELDTALTDGHAKVYYQPKLDLRGNQITCAEALVRWEHPEKGMLSPDSFIPLAEESGRIEELTLFVIRRTIEDMLNWCEKDLVLGAAINISARLLSSQSFLKRAEALISELGVPTSRLTFEVTESAELEDSETSIAALNRFRDRGISISMDDYGTGQSTLSYLKKLPISELKIDRSFVQHCHVDRGDAMLVRSTVQLAHQLGLKVVAEGIEEQGCLDYLRSIDCDYAQGYFVGRPMTADMLMELASKESRKAA
ncbi:MAG: EAL domain-containing protein, partial [Pseudomonadota bacterium]